MRNLSGTGLKAPFLLFVVCSALASPLKTQLSPMEPGHKPVLVELFTSEGCSSCPPADALLQKLEKQQPITGAEVIALEEHVDYWNHDGWVDPYSSPEWTQRQLAYGSVFNNDAYTPELVVNGRSQFVGSNERQAGLEIERATHAAKTEVAIAAGRRDANGAQRFTVSAGKLAGSPSGDVAEVWLAVTEDGLHSAVSRGENAGHVLRHVATLRSLHKIGIADASGASVSFTGESIVKFNSNWDVENLHVIVFIQRKNSREILGAASTRIKG